VVDRRWEGEGRWREEAEKGDKVEKKKILMWRQGREKQNEKKKKLDVKCHVRCRDLGVEGWM